MAVDSATFDFFRKMAYSEAALVIEPGKEYLIETRLLPVARLSGLDSVVALAERLRAESDVVLRRAVVEALTTNETSFFRDPDLFSTIRDRILPELIRARAQSKRISIWCAAASTGQEPYSVAMLLRDLIPIHQGWDLRILATDINTQVLQRARQGRYSQLEVNRGLPVQHLVKYFEKQGNDFFVRPTLKEMVSFSELNLVGPWPISGPFDLILLRNVLIYFDVPTKQQILSRMSKLLSPDGFLFLGAAETTVNIDNSFERVRVEKLSCYKRA